METRRFFRFGTVALAAIIGAGVSWLLGSIYIRLTDAPGLLLVPFLVVLVCAGALSTKASLRPIALGLVLGAGAEVVFFVWLFAQYSSPFFDR